MVRVYKTWRDPDAVLLNCQKQCRCQKGCPNVHPTNIENKSGGMENEVVEKME